MPSGNNKKGFAGLESMVSNVEIPTPPAPLPKSVPQAEPEKEAPAEPQIYQSKPPSPSAAGSSKWWAIGFVIFVIFIIANSSGTKSSSTVPSYEATPAPEVDSAPSHDLTPPLEVAPAPSYDPAPSDDSPASSSSQEEVPPIGNGLAFSRNQIRYCVSEKIRIEAWGGKVNKYSESSVDAFNLAVNDYNARCSNFRYRSGMLESVRSEVETNRDALAAEGMSKALLNP